MKRITPAILSALLSIVAATYSAGAQQRDTVPSIIPTDAFPILLVDDVVRNRLAEEWHPDNRYQHERGYCATFTTEFRWSWDGPIVFYTLTSIRRAEESGTSPNGIMRIKCPDQPDIAQLHTHLSSQCITADDGASCVIGGKWANQCFESPPDRRSLERSKKPFALIQCDRLAIVPVWRRTVVGTFIPRHTPFLH